MTVKTALERRRDVVPADWLAELDGFTALPPATTHAVLAILTNALDS